MDHHGHFVLHEALFWHSQEMSLVLLERQEQRPEGGGR